MNRLAAILAALLEIEVSDCQHLPRLVIVSHAILFAYDSTIEK